MTSAKPWAAGAAALGIAGVFATPVPALAAPEPASCVGFGTFAAQAGTEMFRLNRLEIRAGSPRSTDGSAKKARPAAPAPRSSKPSSAPTSAPPSSAPPSTPPSAAPRGALDGVGDLLGVRAQARKPTGPGTTNVHATPAPPSAGEPPAPRATFVPVARESALSKRPTDRSGDFAVRDVLVGEAKSALVTNGRPNSAAVTRMVNSSEKSKLSNPLVQQAPPANPNAARRQTPAAEVGPLLIDGGALSSHARNGCTDGEATRSSAALGAFAIADHTSDALVTAPDRMTAVSTTALDHSGPHARSASSAAMTAGSFELLDGAVQVNVVRSPRLTTALSVTGTAEVRYTPAIIEISGDGIKTTKLDTAGDSMEMTFSNRTESGGLPGLPGWDEFPVEPPLTLPTIPGVPILGGGQPEAAPANGPGTTVRVGLGKARQATEPNAVAARATAIEVSITKRDPAAAGGSTRPGPSGSGSSGSGSSGAGSSEPGATGGGSGDRGKPGYGGAGVGASVKLDMTIGVLESAAVAARPTGRGVSAGAAGGLPVTGPGVAAIVIGGVGLLAAGAVAFTFGRRRRTFRA